MARPKTIKHEAKEIETIETVVNAGLIKVRVVKKVEGRNIGDEFETSRYAVRFQLKHKSIIEI